MTKKLNLDSIEIQSFVTRIDSNQSQGGRLAAAPGGVVIAPGETLDENPCTFDTMRDC